MSTTANLTSVILFTKNWAGKAQAGRFSAEEVERATAAALKHEASAVTFAENDDADLIAAIPAGKFGEGDRPVLGNIKTEIFKRLAGLAEQQAKTAPAAESPAKAADATEAEAKANMPSHKKAAAMISKATDKATGEMLVSVVVKEGAKHWPQLKKGDIVLAPDFGEGEYNGWWEAVVQARSDSHVTLEWRDYADFPTFTRPITQIAPIHPECKVEA